MALAKKIRQENLAMTVRLDKASAVVDVVKGNRCAARSAGDRCSYPSVSQKTRKNRV